MGQSSSTQREQRHQFPSEHTIPHQRSYIRNRHEDMNNGHNTEQVGGIDPLTNQEAGSSDVPMIHPREFTTPTESWQSPIATSGDIPDHSTQMGSIQEESGSQYEASQQDYQSAILARVARRQSAMSRLGSRILPNSVIRGLLNSEEETPAEGHAHRHGIVSRTIPRSEVNQSSPRFSPFASLSSRGGNRRRSFRGPYFNPRDTAMNSHSGYSGTSSGVSAESPASAGGWRRNVRLRRVGHSISTPIAQMFGQPSSDPSHEQGAEDPHIFHSPDPVDFIPHPGPIDTRMDFDPPHELDSGEPALGDQQPTSPLLSSQNQSSGRHFPSLLRARPSRALRREEQTPLSRVLQLAATAIAAQLSGGPSPALPNIQSLGNNNDGQDGSLESFIQSLQRATSGPQPPADTPDTREEERPPTPVNFMRVFRFANSDSPRSPEASNRARAESSDAQNHEDNMDTDHHADGPEGRTVTLVVVGVRSVPSGNSPSSGDQQPAALPGLDALLRLPFLAPGTMPPRVGSRPAATTTSSRPNPGVPSNDDIPPPLGSSNALRRTSDAGSRGPPSSLPSIVSDSPPGPHPPPSTPAEPGLSAVSSGASTPSRRLSTTSAMSPTVLPQLNENRSMQPAVESSDEAFPLSTSHQRRRSDSEFARHREQLGSGAARRNGVVEPDNHNAPTGRSWLIYVVGTNLSENHPAFAAPSLFTDVSKPVQSPGSLFAKTRVQNPTYEDMVLLSSLLGPVKPPVATQEDLTSAGGLYRVEEYGGSLSAESVDHSDSIQLAEGERCLICLSEYEAAEEVRQLTKCEHIYHRICIDQVRFIPASVVWLFWTRSLFI